jgi:hypothetical protein
MFPIIYVMYKIGRRRRWNGMDRGSSSASSRLGAGEAIVE